jgi:type IV secretory pathway VirB10-like protein
MQGKTEQAIPQAVIKDKDPKPAGLLPKNLQALVVLGGALLMVVVMALTGHKAPVPPVAPATAATPNLSPLNTAKISEFQKQIEDAQRSTAPQTEAALLREQKQSAAERQGPAQPFPTSPYGTPVTAPNTAGAYPPGAYASALPQPGEGQTTADPLKDEQRKRHYLSLFSDNVALTYRKGERNPTGASVADPEVHLAQNADSAAPQDPLTLRALTELARQSELGARAQQTGLAPRPGESVPGTRTQIPNNLVTNPNSETGSQSRQSANPNPTVASSGSDPIKKYVLFEGTILEAVLINRLDGSFSGPVECLISTDVYSHDRQHLVIPAGTKVLGTASKVDTFGQARLAVAFHRVIMPDGYSVSLDQFKGLDQEGATALKDKVNNHYAKIFGSSLALGVLGGAAQIGTGNVLNSSRADRMREGFGAGLADAGEQILDRFLNILPTVTIREGTRVKIYLSDDLLLPDYHYHNLPPNL